LRFLKISHRVAESLRKQSFAPPDRELFEPNEKYDANQNKDSDGDQCDNLEKLLVPGTLARYQDLVLGRNEAEALFFIRPPQQQQREYYDDGVDPGKHANRSQQMRCPVPGVAILPYPRERQPKSQHLNGKLSKDKHFYKRFDLEFVSLGLYKIAATPDSSAKNNHAAGRVISKRSTCNGVKKAHLHILLGEIPQAWLPSQFRLEKLRPLPAASTGVMAELMPNQMAL
jgi:hypothetical protein